MTLTEAIGRLAFIALLLLMVVVGLSRAIIAIRTGEDLAAGFWLTLAAVNFAVAQDVRKP